MTHWQFILQKEGEKSWLPLTTNTLAVEAGRYRLVAETSYPSTPVEVVINYCDTTQVPPQPIIQKRSRQINSHGWMVVIPYIFLKPGRWELACCAQEDNNPGDHDSNLEVETESNSPSWQEKVILEVTPSQPEVNSFLSCGGTDNFDRVRVTKAPQNTDKITFVSSDFSPHQESSQERELILGSDSATDLVATPNYDRKMGKSANSEEDKKNDENVDTFPASNSQEVKSVYLELFKFTNSSPTLPKYPFFSPPLETTTELGIASMGDKQEGKLIAVSTLELEQEDEDNKELTPSSASDLEETETSLDIHPLTSDLEEIETSIPPHPPKSKEAKAQDQIPITPEMEKAFRALNLDQRFWLRLSSIAKDHESVVENDTDSSSSVTSPTDNESGIDTVVESVPETSAKDIPTPVLMVSEGELEAGKPAFVRVKLPSDADSIYVRIWMQDRQTRYLLDQPRNLVQFTRNKQGELEALTQITVPLGSSQIHFEAIAIDMETQRESHKAMVDRVVIPADLPDVSWEEFED